MLKKHLYTCMSSIYDIHINSYYYIYSHAILYTVVLQVVDILYFYCKSTWCLDLYFTVTFSHQMFSVFLFLIFFCIYLMLVDY